MEDTTFTSLLTASDVALYQIAVILEDKNSGGAPSSTTKKTLDAWVAAADQNVESLWDDSTKRCARRERSGAKRDAMRHSERVELWRGLNRGARAKRALRRRRCCYPSLVGERARAAAIRLSWARSMKALLLSVSRGFAR
jgi:hypothetical protein